MTQAVHRRAQADLGVPGVHGGLDRLLVLWLAMVSTDRIDFLGGSTGFVLTPYLAFTPVIAVIAAWLALKGRGRIVVPGTLRPYALLVACLLAVTALSGLVGIDPAMSARRMVHLVTVMVGTLIIAVVLVSRPTFRSILARGAVLGLLLAFVFSVATIWAVVSGNTTLHVGPATLALDPVMYGSLMPRLSATVLDSNRAGIDLLFFVYLLGAFGRPGATRRVWMTAGVVMAALTLSRSALLAALALGFTAWLVYGAAGVTRPRLLAACTAVVLVSGLFLARPRLATAVGKALEPVAERLSPREASTRDHLSLLVRGAEAGTRSIPRAAIGIGYGNAHRLVADMFAGSEYGNFHSDYVSLLVESGVFALLLFLAVLAFPVLRPGPFLPMVAALAAFNMFYQAGNSPLQWTVLALAWFVPFGPRAVAPIDPVTAESPT